MPTIRINGEPRAIDARLSVAALIDVLGLDACKVAIERNAAIVSRSDHARTLLEEGDSLEIVHFIGGG